MIYLFIYCIDKGCFADNYIVNFFFFFKFNLFMKLKWTTEKGTRVDLWVQYIDIFYIRSIWYFVFSYSVLTGVSHKLRDSACTLSTITG